MFYGLSSATKSFPKGVKVEVFKGSGSGDLRGKAAKVAAEVDKVWNENVGSLSRTARLASDDVKFLAKRLGVKADDKTIEEWMKAIAESNSNVYLVMVTHNKKVKLLLVNTDVTK